MSLASAPSAPEVATPASIQRQVSESSGTRPWPLALVVAGLSALAIWLVSPRFAIDGPSLVDDWAAISRSPDQVSNLLHLSNPEPERFRPAWIFWNYVQWNTFDAPRGLVGPNAWNVVRILLFVVGITLMTWLLLPQARARREAVIRACLAGIPVFAVIAVPKFARDFAWFGPQEPLLLGGLALGGSLLALAARALLAEDDPRPFVTAVMAVAGSLFWLVGVYEKELSLCAIPLVAAVLFGSREKARSWSRRGTGRRVALGAVGAVVVLPLLHVAVETARITIRGDIVYEAKVDGGAGIVHGLHVLYDWSHEAMPLQSRYLLVAALVLTAVAAVYRRRVDVLALGALASGALATVFAAQSGVAVSRYYIPLVALFAVALSLSLARFPELVRAAGVLFVFFAFVPLTETRAEVQRWSDEEQQHALLVRRVADLERSGCTVAVAGLDLETGLALPVLVGLDRSSSGQQCAEGGAYLVLPPYFDDNLSLAKTCAPGALEPLVLGRLAGVYECRRLRAGKIADPKLGSLTSAELLAAYRLRPASVP